MKKVVQRQGGGRGQGSQKWVPKADGTEDEPEKEASLDAEVEVEYDTKNEGPHYTRDVLLRAIHLYKKGLDQGAAVVEALKTLKTGSRPLEDGQAGHVPGTRRALAEQKKAQKKGGRTDSADAEEEIVGTISSGRERTMSENMQSMADPDMMMWLQTMQQWMVQNMSAASAQTSGYTTVMLRNIPNRYTRDMLVQRLNKSQGYEKQFDFVYLPIDFNSKCNVGYAFINFRTPAAAAKFMQEFHKAQCSKVLPGFSSQKVVEVCYARVQGKDQNMDNLRDEKFIEKLSEHAEWQPLFLDDDNKEISFAKLLGDKGDKGKRGRAGSASTATASPAGAAMPAAMMPPWAQYGWPGMAPPIPQGKKGQAAAPSGKGKGGKGKGKAVGADAALAAAQMGYAWQGYGGYGNPYAMAAYQRQMMAYHQQAHAHAAAAASAHAGGADMLDNLGAAMTIKGRPRKPLNPEQTVAVKAQFEFYFSADNLCKDLYLRQHMDAEGWTSLDLLCNFKKIQAFNTTVESISEALASSESVEVDAQKRRVRLKDPEMRQKWCEAATEMQQATTPKAPISLSQAVAEAGK